jgi:ADP-dependent NAD(P)H-hydrate dehydratase / NAD(P)H-hydrate epimerase
MATPASHPILSCAEAKTWETQLLKDGPAEWAAMQHAGRKIAVALVNDSQEIGGLPADARLLVLTGKGNNGGDALLAAETLLALRPKATAVLVLAFDRAALRPLAARALGRLMKLGVARVAIVSEEQALAPDRSYDVCLDGIFGFQFRPPMGAAIAKLIGRVNAHASIRLRAAVDLPSGLGGFEKTTVFRADFTYATGIVKQPVIDPGKTETVGRLRYLDLDFFADEIPLETDQHWVSDRVLLPSVLNPLGELRPAKSDKRTYGHLVVVGGSHSYPGAVMLATRAALRSGTGLVTAFVPRELAAAYAAAQPEAMWVGCPQTKGGGLGPGAFKLVEARLQRASALLIGPGIGTDPQTLALVGRILDEVKVPVVIDADALRPELIERLRSKVFICTPHAGEFQRIKPALYKGDRFVPRHGVLVLKGAMTRVTDGGVNYHSAFGGPVLARGGSGDTLAGMIGGLLAQRPADALTAACRGVVWHGMAADLLARARGQVAVENAQILEQLGPALLSSHARLTDGAAGVHGSERSA